jgi:Zn-dependent metalloprotease/uncharacterized membrane protein
MKKFVSIVTVAVVLFCFMTTGTWAARKIDFYNSNAKQFVNQLNKSGSFELGNMAANLGLSGDEAFNLLRSNKDLNGITHYRFQQSYMDIPLWGMQTVVSVSPAKKAWGIHGAMLLDIPMDVKGVPKKSTLNPEGALRQMQEEHRNKDKKATWHFSQETFGTYIYFHKKKAYLVYVVSFFADNEKGNPSRYVYFVNAKTGNLLHKYNNLQRADVGTGPGGNLKVGYYYYGTDFPPFGVTVNGSTCTMDTTDVKSVNLNHGTSGSTAYSYTCYENLFKEINGAYSPINDAQFFGQVVFDMFMDWYGVPPLTFQLMMRVHYSTNYENAFWNGSSMTFGDGYTTFYPLVALDVSAHEVSHGFTEQNSGLIYSGQSGGINEAYSDMAGESAEYYSRGSTDYMVGYDIFKSPSGALRYMYDPPLDGNSIDHVSQYYSGLDVHYSSGVFNKVYWLVATTSGWTPKMAFDIFTKANQNYWTPSTTFQQGGEGVMNAAVDLGYNCQDVVNAFAVVGVPLTCPGPPIADFSGTPTSGGYPLTVTFTDLSQGAATWSWNFGDTGTSTEQNPVHTYTAMGTYTVTLTVTNQFGSDTAVKTNYITVTAPQIPVADFVASSTDINIADSVTFTDLTTENPYQWAWTFEGGTPATSTVQNPTVTYNTAGTFTVTLTATNVVGSDTETKVGYINVTVKPYCTSSGNSQSYEYIAGVQVADLNNPSGATPYSDFTSLTAHVNQEDTVNVALTPGFTSSAYTEWWKIWVDYNGDHDFEDAGEEVFSGSGSSVVSGSFVVPTNTVIGNTRMRVSMSYSTYPPMCGTFTYGEVEDYTINISTTTGQPPVAEFSGSPTTVTEGGSVAFTDLSTGSPDTWDWTFPGGTPSTSTQQNPTVTYSTAGTYDVTLTVTNAYGTDTQTKQNYITVTAQNQDPTADFTFTTSCLTANFTDASTDPDGTIASWLWDFGDGNSSTQQNPSHTYAAGGTYTVTLTVTDNDGGTDSVSKLVTVTDCAINLAATAYKSKGTKYVDLVWSGATGANVNIYRDGNLIASVPNTGTYTDNLGKGGKATYTYQVCETDGSVCSNTVNVTI